MTLNVAVIGLGVGERHLEGFIANSKCRVVGICDFDQNRLNSVAMRYPNVALKTTNANEILTDAGIDLISIASWDSYHADQILLGLQHNKHLFVEKPLCLKVDQAQKIYEELLKKPQLKLSTNLILRYYPRFQDLKLRCEQNELGDLMYLEGDYNYGRIHKITSGWRSRDPGYSAILGGGIHIVDLLLWLRSKRVSKVAAFGNKIATSDSIFENFDLVSCVLYFEDGVVAKISVNLGCVYPHLHRVSIYGTRATYENSFEGAHIYTKFDNTENDNQIEYDRKNINLPYPGASKSDLLADFIESILTKTPAPISTKEIFDSLSVCFALEKAVHSQLVEPVNYIYK